MKVLVTGGAGYLGSVLVRKLLLKGHTVRVLDNLLHEHHSLLGVKDNPSFQLMTGEIRHIDTLLKASKDMDAVIHLAAIVGDQACDISPIDTVGINYMATSILAECCIYWGIDRYIFGSTCSVYGQSSEVVSEESSLNPVSLYADLKIKAEHELQKKSGGDLNPCILRMSTLYGISPRMRFDLVVNILTARAYAEKKIVIYGGEQWRPCLNVEDAADAFVLVLDSPLKKVSGATFNVGSNNQNYQITELGDIVHKYIPESQIEVQGSSDTRSYRVSFNKIKEILSYEPKKTVEDSVKEIINAFENNVYADYRDVKYNNYRSILNSDIYRSIQEHDTIDK